MFPCWEHPFCLLLSHSPPHPSPRTPHSEVLNSGIIPLHQDIITNKKTTNKLADRQKDGVYISYSVCREIWYLRAHNPQLASKLKGSIYPNEVGGIDTCPPEEVHKRLKALLTEYRQKRPKCLANGIIPFIITDELKMFYYRGLKEWGHIDGYLTDTCLTAQDQYKNLLRYFKLKA